MRLLTDLERAALEAYRSETLPPAERAALEQKLRDDADFRGAASEWLGLAAVTGDLRERDFIARLAGWQAELPPAVPLSGWRRRPLWHWGIAGLLALLGGLLLWKMLAPRVDTPAKRGAQIAADFFRPELVPGFKMSTPTGPELSPGRQAYAFKRYQEAIPLLREEFAQSASTDSVLLVYLGCAYLAEGQPEEAAGVLSPLTGSPQFGQKARWYLALGYLQAGQIERARPLLRALETDPRGAFSTEAAEVLRALEISE